MPSRWRVELRGPVGVEVPIEAPHAVVSRWLDADHSASTKPYAICPPTGTGATTVLEVRLLDDALAGRLVAAAPAGTQVRLGSHHFSVARPPWLVEGQSWPELAGDGTTRAWTLRFRTPATFRRGDRSTPWPAPESVTRSLAQRWLALDRPSAPAWPPGGFRSLWVSDLDGHSVAVRRAGLLACGFVGQVRYVCDGPDAEAAGVDGLFRFAAYAGVGSHTAFGFGVTDVEPDRVAASSTTRAG